MTASLRFLCSLFFSTPPATPESYTLSLHDALPICEFAPVVHVERLRVHVGEAAAAAAAQDQAIASGVEGALRREQHHARVALGEACRKRDGRRDGGRDGGRAVRRDDLEAQRRLIEERGVNLVAEGHYDPKWRSR